MLKTNSLMRSEVMPFIGQFTLLVVSALMGDLVLEYFELKWVGRFLGIPGTLMIVLSLIYSIRKRTSLQVGKPKLWLRLHEVFTWIGCLMVLIHAGVHFNAVLPRLAMIAMVFNVLSGLVGRSLLERSRRHIREKQAAHKSQGLSQDEVEQEVFWDSVTYDLMNKWRVVHFPLSAIFATLTIAHIVSILLFWDWK